MRKRIFCAMLAAVMGFSMLTTVESPTKVQAAGIVMEYPDINSNAASTVKTIKADVLKTENDLELATKKAYALVVTNDEDKSLTVPIKVTTDGKLNYSIVNHNENSTGTVTYTLSKDEKGKKVVASGKEDLSSDKGYDKLVKVSKGTYYLTIKMKGNIVKDGLFYVQAHVYPIGDRVLTNNVLAISASNGKKATYYKVTVSKPSILAFQFSGYELRTGKITLCDRNKKAISATSVIGKGRETGLQTYVVGKGTYYYKFTTTNSTYQVLSNTKAYTDKAGKSATKAKALKINTETEGFVSLGDKKGTVDYYKATATKEGQVKGLYVAFGGEGTVQVTIKAPGIKAKTMKVPAGKCFYINTIYQEKIENGRTYYRNIKFPKGEYTIKVKKLTGKTNGVYYIGTKQYKE